MKEKNTVKIVTIIIRVFGCLALLCGGLIAQEPSAAKTEAQETSAAKTEAQETSISTKEVQVNSSKPRKNVQTKSGGYDIKSSIEFGYRFRSLDGNENKYRSDLNYKPGVRLFDSTFLATAEDSDGKPFDSFLVTGTGWGNGDPNGYSRINIEKTGWYKFDGSLRRFKYFNNLLNLALNEHTRNTKHNMGDFDVVILPQNDFRFRLGYSFDRNSGPQTRTFDFSRDEFLIDSEYDTDSNDFRFGIDAKVAGFNLSFTEGYRRFNDNTTFFLPTGSLGNNETNNSEIATFRRDQPTSGKTWYSRFSINRTFNKRVDFTGRFIYSDTRSEFSLIESLTGTDRNNNTINFDDVTATGDAKRPNGFGDVGVTVFVTDKFSISDTFGVNAYRISGGNNFLERVSLTNSGGMALPLVIDNELVWRFTNYRRYINTLEGNYDVNRYFTFYAGYRYTDRQVTLEGFNLDLLSSSTDVHDNHTVNNRTHSLIAGFKAKPIVKKWTMNFDVETGTTDNVFTRLANYDFTHIRFRNRFFPTDKLTFSFIVETKDNTNPSQNTSVPPVNFPVSSKLRNFGGSVSWAPSDTVAVNGGYNYSRITTEGGVIFPVSGGSASPGLSRYLLRNNYGYIDGWFRPHDRFSFFGAYRISKDTGDGDIFVAADRFIEGNYPIQFQSPEFRLIFKINDNIDWNFGYQYYKYDEKLLNNQDYSAHLPFTSLRIYFGGSKDR